MASDKEEDRVPNSPIY